jgi:hypothetical protein
LPLCRSSQQDVIAFEPTAVQRGEMIERMLRKILGPQMILSSSHGSLVTEGGGLQEIHQDQVGAADWLCC